MLWPRLLCRPPADLRLASASRAPPLAAAVAAILFTATSCLSAAAVAVAEAVAAAKLLSATLCLLARGGAQERLRDGWVGPGMWGPASSFLKVAAEAAAVAEAEAASFFIAVAEVEAVAASPPASSAAALLPAPSLTPPPTTGCGGSTEAGWDRG